MQLNNPACSLIMENRPKPYQTTLIFRSELMSNLFQPLNVGDYTLKNRIIMAPLTRSRANNPGRIPNELMVKYYRQRASAGMILTEATSVTPMGVGYPDTPGIWTNEQTEGWKPITQAVHEQGGNIFMQLWHVGRISDPCYLGGELPVAPSAIAAPGHVSHVRPLKDLVTPRALSIEEIKNLQNIYRQAAENAKEAGFDGVELHAANGYLFDQFMHESSNKRTDEYGGSIENRVRLLLEIVDVLIEVWGAGKVGVHLAPASDGAGLEDSDPQALFSYVAKQLSTRNIAFIFAREDTREENTVGKLVRENFDGVYIANQQLTKETGEQLLKAGRADAVAYGELFIANPDLVERFKEDAQLNTPNRATYYFNEEVGYTDYPFLETT
ncbi:alkene reductase [Reinekea marina]|nr:alkene reductase [Reinekea marina]MDN3648041.1 alkene reductase [Reinekea marina]